MIEIELFGHIKKNKNFNKFYMKRVAAIDFGSNAIRLTIAEVISPGEFKIIEKFRFPVRIGTDVFTKKEVSASKVDEILEVFRKFCAHITYYQVQEVQAVATSALRDAKNADQILRAIEANTKIKLKTITGAEEARLIYEVIAHDFPIITGTTLLVDIGGGSTELSIINEGILGKVQSFNIGTIRLLKDQENELSQLMESVRAEVTGKKVKLVGTGGNLRRMGKLRKKIFDRADSSIIHKTEVFEMFNHLKEMTPLQLMKKYDLKTDRAEVIVPALKILTSILTDINVDIIHLPKVGLSEALILSMSTPATFTLTQ